MGNIVFFVNVEKTFQMLEKSKLQLEQQNYLSNGNKCFLFNSESIWNNSLQVVFEQAEVVIFCWQGPIYDTPLSTKAASFLQKVNSSYLFMSLTDISDKIVKKISDDTIHIVRQYILYSGNDNYCNLWLYLRNKICSDHTLYEMPRKLPWMGIYHPRYNKYFSKIEDYLRLYPDVYSQIIVGIIFTRESWIWKDVDYLNQLILKLEEKGMLALPIFGIWSNNQDLEAPGIAKGVNQFFYLNNRKVVHAVINTFKVGLTQTRQNDQQFLINLNVPILQAYNLLRTQEEWQNSLIGMNPVELSCNVVQPEFDGVIHGLPVSTKETDAGGIKYYRALEERIEKFVLKVKKWAILHKKKNNEKKIAIIFHNYPPTNDSIGTAQGLDSLESAAILMRNMADKGYDIHDLPASGKELIDQITNGITNDRIYLSDQQMGNPCGYVTEEEYKRWFHTLEQAFQETMIEEWGQAPGEVFYSDHKLIIPGKINGNIFIGMQPPRGFGENVSKIIHSPTCPPPHHYLAFYYWLREIWQADAVIHVGTHGSLEWLPGKNAGLSNMCCPDVALGDLPNIYPYYITIVGEGIQAKRRGAACLIGHLNPPMSHAGTYDELAELESLLDEYTHFKIEQQGNCDIVAAKIEKKILKMKLDEDLPRKAEESLDTYILKIHAYISKLKHMEIRVGLHILGRIPNGQILTDFLLALTRMENKEIPSLPKMIAASYGYDYYALEEKSGDILLEDKISCAEILDKVWLICRKIISKLQDEDFQLTSFSKIFSLPELKELKLDEGLKEQLIKTLEYVCQVIVPNLRKTQQEISNTLRALNGEFIEPGPGGAPTSGRADILPTGRNFYGVDPNNLPTPIAWEIGKTLAEQVIARYIGEEGCYPENIGMVFWSDSNMRSNGQCIAEYLYLMGVKPIWQKGSLRIIGLEIISLSKLKRPRIDVTARISGLFRDSMTIAVEWMEKAVEMVKSLDELDDMNFVKKHIGQDVEEMMQQGVEESQARQQASYRIFGCPPGGYGAGVAALIEEKNWETIHDVSDVYVRWGAHIYGKETNGEFLPELFRKRLSAIDVTIKNIDNHEVHLLNSDDFNAYCGGMNAAVQSIRGKTPRCYIGDSTDIAHVETKSLDEEFRRVFRGESMNPKYIQGMKKHGYKGASDIAATIARAYAWDVTSNVMKDWMYEEFAKKFALDNEFREWMKEVNPWALKRIAEKLLEAEQRGLWNADLETENELGKLYLDIEGELEEKSDMN